MRNIVISLLLADATNAQKSYRDDPMERDKAVKKPSLIADVWSSDGCVNAAVTAAKTKVDTADADWKARTAEKVKTQDAAVTAAIAEKKTAVDAVLAKDTAMAADVKTDDTAQQKELTLKQALDNATYAKNAAVADAAAKATAKTTADTAKAAGIALQTAMNTAASSALTHYTAEQGQTASKTIARNTAEGTYNTEFAKTAGLLSSSNTAKGLYDTKKDDHTEKTRLNSIAQSIKSKTAAVLVTATAAINAGTNGSVAKTLATETSTMTGKTTALATAAAAWQVEGKKLTEARKGFDGSDTWETPLTTQKGCSGGTMTTDKNKNMAACKTACLLLKAWKVDGNGQPDGVGTGSAYCFGLSNKVNECLFVEGNYAALVAGSGGDDAKTCVQRTKSKHGKNYDAALLLAKTGASLHNTYNTKLGEWETQGGVVSVAQGKVDIATKYKGLVNTDSTAKDTAAGTTTTNLATALSALTPLQSDYSTKLTTYNTNVALVATKKAEWDKLKAEVTAQTTEETNQLAIKTLADGDKTAQDTAVTALNTAAGAAATAKTTADGVVTTKTTEEGTAQTAYNAQVTAAAATATALTTPLGALTTLRATAATKTTALATAITNQKAQAALIVTSAQALGTAKGELLAAVVACKELEFDKYKKTLATAESTRAANLKTIEALVAAKGPLAGKQDARCEKALSNGTMRPKRNEKTCDTGLCCGAAKRPMGKTMVTYEVCNDKTKKTWDWQPPRPAMKTTNLTKVPLKFACIEGAKKVAATASAMAAALYMMA